MSEVAPARQPLAKFVESSGTGGRIIIFVDGNEGVLGADEIDDVEQLLAPLPAKQASILFIHGSDYKYLLVVRVGTAGARGRPGASLLKNFVLGRRVGV